MKTFAQKQSDLTTLKEKLGGSKLTVFTSFARAGEKGLGVKQMQDLKKSLREAGAEYVVSKKSLLQRALKDARRDVEVSNFDGSVGVVFGTGDEAATAKSLHLFAKKNAALKFFGALFGARYLGEKEVAVLATLPGRDVLLARTVGMIQYPLSGLVRVLQGNMRNLVGVLQQIAQKK